MRLREAIDLFKDHQKDNAKEKTPGGYLENHSPLPGPQNDSDVSGQDKRGLRPFVGWTCCTGNRPTTMSGPRSGGAKVIHGIQ